MRGPAGGIRRTGAGVGGPSTRTQAPHPLTPNPRPKPRAPAGKASPARDCQNSPVPASERDRFWRNHLWWPLLVCAIVLIPFELTLIDGTIAGACYDNGAHRWRAAGAWWADVLVHKRGRQLIGLIAAVALFSAIGFAFSPRRRRHAWGALYLFLNIGVTTGVIRALKILTNRFCPRQMTAWGGWVPYTRLFDGTPAGFTGGECFPAGHASGPLALLSLYFVARASGASRPALWLLPGLLLGTLYGATQMLRGAHFLSHNIWTLAIAWLVALGLATAFGDRLDLRARESSG